MRNLRFFLLLVAIATVNAVTAQSEIMSYEKLDDKTGVASLNGMGGLAVYSELDNLSINITNAKDERVTKGLVGNGMYEYKVTINPNETLNGKVEVNWGVERLTFLTPIRANFLTAYSVEKVKHPIRLVDRTSDTDVYFDAARAQVEITSAVADLKVNVSPNLRADIQTGVKDKTTGITTTTITFPIKTLTDARGKLDDAERAYEAVDACLKQAEGKQLSQRQREQLVNEHRQAEKLMFASRDALAALTHISVYGNGSNVLDIDISSARARSKFCWGVESRESVSPSKQSSGSSHNTLTSQYVLFNLSPDNAVVELDGQMLETVDGTATKRMPFGTYNYRVQAPKHAPKTGSLTVSDPKNKHVVSVTLAPQFGNFTFTVADNAEIWIDEQLRGTGSCTVELGYGTYLVECRKAGYRPTSQEVVVGKDNAKEKITLNPPTPIYGSIDINSAPANAEVWIDGKQVGTTPMFLSECLAGSHEIKLKKQGYKGATLTAKVEEGQTAVLQQTLEKGFSSEGNTFTVNGVSFKMIAVEGGTFRMGSANHDPDEKPVHSVTLSDYYVGETEVTQALWKAVMGNNPSHFKGDNLPVEIVSWEDCQTFITKLNSLTGANFRLPTEAEWEFAARGGNKSQGYTYSGSNRIGKVAWCWNNSGSKTHAVKTKSPNELGIYDMSGNVWEWCLDWYGDYSSSPQTNPKGPISGLNRVYRGGSWDNFSTFCRTSIRYKFTPDYRSSRLGFRLAMTADAKEGQRAKVEEGQTAALQQTLEKGFSSYGKTFTVKGVTFKMIAVEGGTFRMGSASGGSNEKPVHSVTLSDYYVGETEVTQALWKAVMGCNPSNFKGDNLPVEYVSYKDCETFITKLNSLTGANFRLPTEAEWEFAARGGNKSQGYTYSGSNTISNVAWYYNNSSNKTHAVKTKSPNELGIYDMSGNVWEWCLDWYGDYSSSPQTNPKGPISERIRVLRGGSWDFDSYFCRSSNRSSNTPDYGSNYLGFRLAMTADVKEGQRANQISALKEESKTAIAVDLGLPSGTLWADRNVGADSPEDYGDYFAWGETEPKSTYSWSNYKWCNSNYKQLTKYCTYSGHGYNGFKDNKNVLEASDDAATQNMGNNWRMPTESEIQELIDKCAWKWTTQNGVNGYKVIGRNHKSIFLPATDNPLGYYWSSCKDWVSCNEANYLVFHSSKRELQHVGRHVGKTIRAVVVKG